MYTWPSRTPLYAKLSPRTRATRSPTAMAWLCSFIRAVASIGISIGQTNGNRISLDVYSKVSLKDARLRKEEARKVAARVDPRHEPGKAGA